jgi:FkbM family methyltransferase
MQPIWRGKHRKAWFADVCLSPKSYPFWTSFLNRDDYTVGSKIGDPKEVDYPDHQNWTPFKVPCFPIYSLLSAMGVKEVDFFNLDVEGVEMDVLKNIPWKDILIKVIVGKIE